MVKNMSVMGVGGKIALVLLLALAVTAGASYWVSPLFRLTENYYQLLIAGLAMMALGFTLNLIAAFGMLSAYRKGSLATDGLYSIFLHPMYALQILITVPGLLLLFNSWLVLMSIIPAFIAYKIFAREEERYLEANFDDQYKSYRNKVLIKFL